MRRAAIALEAVALVDEDDLEEAREFVNSRLGLEQPADAVGALHRAVSTSGAVARAYREPCVSLFNRFTIDNTPTLRGLVD
jgi:Flp pilus assembly protein TadD